MPPGIAKDYLQQPSEETARLSRSIPWPELGLALLFMVSRLVVKYVLGLSFDADPLVQDYVQYIDVDSLRNRLAHSLLV